MTYIGLIFGLWLATWPARHLARRLDLQPRWPFAVIGAQLAVFVVIMALGAVGLPITFWAVAAGLVLCRVAVMLVPQPVSVLGPDAPPAERAEADSFRPGAMVGIAASVLTAWALWTMIGKPLGGYDTIWRWDRLARLIADRHTIGFYPPVTDADYDIYPYPDGFALLQPALPAWLYVCAGKASVWISGLWAAVQWVAILSAARAGVRHWADRLGYRQTGGKVAVGVVAGTATLVMGVAIGQETGLTALGTVFAIACMARTGRSWAVAAGLAAACAGSARDYGPALAAALVTSAFLMQGWRYAATMLLTALLFVCIGPAWDYARTGTAVFGSPAMPPSANPVLHEWLAYYPTRLGWSHLADVDRNTGLLELLMGAGPAVVLGLIALWRLRSQLRWRGTTALLVPIVVTVALWCSSMSYTAGGLIYSLRVLTPALAVLAMAAGLGAPRWPWAFRLVMLAGLAVTAHRLYHYESGVGLGGTAIPITATRAAVPAGSVILSDDPAFTAILGDMKADTGIRVLSAWAPAARPIILAESPEELHAALAAAGVTHVYFQLTTFPEGGREKLAGWGIHCDWMWHRRAWADLPQWPVVAGAGESRSVRRVIRLSPTPSTRP